MQTFLDMELDLDEEGLADERGSGPASEIVGDKDIRLMLRRNRIALAKGAVTRVAGAGGVVGYDIPLTCAVHSDPDCRFRWSRLIVDLTATPGARIADMVPREVLDDQPVELTTTIGLGLKFNVASTVLGAELTPQYSQKRTVYYPQIVSSGTGFARGYWDFLALDDRYLHADRELRLLAEAPVDAPVSARFQLRAKVKLAGIAGLIPLLARSGAIEGVYRLDA
jgi:hypothetical protein